MKIAMLLALLATPVAADLSRTIEDHILPGYASFATQTAVLLDAAIADCAPAGLQAPYQAAFDAWMGVSHLRLGPAEQDSRTATIAYWPDERGATPKVLAELMATADPVIETAEGMRRVSVAGRGLFALEFLLYAPEFADETPYSCALIRAVTADLANMAGGIHADWLDGYADTLRSAGADSNSTYLTGTEATQALFTALITGLEFTQDQRLGRPLGTFDRPRPTRAEAWRSGRSQRNVVLSLQALAALADTLSDAETPLTDAALAKAIGAAQALDDPILAGVSVPQSRLKLEIVQQAIHTLRDTILAEMGTALGVSAGFNAADGD